MPHRTTRCNTNTPLFAQGKFSSDSRAPLIDVNIFNKLQSDYLQLTTLPLNDLPENNRYHIREDAKTVKKAGMVYSIDDKLL